jgi:hypothetical protein
VSLVDRSGPLYHHNASGCRQSANDGRSEAKGVPAVRYSKFRTGVMSASGRASRSDGLARQWLGIGVDLPLLGRSANAKDCPLSGPSGQPPKLTESGGNRSFAPTRRGEPGCAVSSRSWRSNPGSTIRTNNAIRAKGAAPSQPCRSECWSAGSPSSARPHSGHRHLGSPLSRRNRRRSEPRDTAPPP